MRANQEDAEIGKFFQSCCVHQGNCWHRPLETEVAAIPFVTKNFNEVDPKDLSKNYLGGLSR